MRPSALRDEMMMYRGTASVSIANGQALSSSFVLDQSQLISGVFMPAAWTAAVLTLQTSMDNGTTWNEVVKADGTAYQLTVAASQAVMIPPADLIGIPPNALVRLRSGTSGTPVNQGAARSVTVVLSGDRA